MTKQIQCISFSSSSFWRDYSGAHSHCQLELPRDEDQVAHGGNLIMCALHWAPPLPCALTCPHSPWPFLGYLPETYAKILVRVASEGSKLEGNIYD